MTITYGIIEEIYSIGCNRRVTYGIAAYSFAEADGTATVIASIHDITDDKEKLSLLVDTCNSLELSVIHLYDVVEDFLVD